MKRLLIVFLFLFLFGCTNDPEFYDCCLRYNATMDGTCVLENETKYTTEFCYYFTEDEYCFAYPDGSKKCDTEEDKIVLVNTCNVTPPGKTETMLIPICGELEITGCTRGNCVALICGDFSYLPKPTPSTSSFTEERDKVGFEGQTRNLYGVDCRFEKLTPLLLRAIQNSKGKLYALGYRFGVGSTFNEYDISSVFFPVTDADCRLNPMGDKDRYMNYLAVDMEFDAGGNSFTEVGHDRAGSLCSYSGNVELLNGEWVCKTNDDISSYSHHDCNLRCWYYQHEGGFRGYKVIHSKRIEWDGGNCILLHGLWIGHSSICSEVYDEELHGTIYDEFPTAQKCYEECSTPSTTSESIPPLSPLLDYSWHDETPWASYASVYSSVVKERGVKGTPYFAIDYKTSSLKGYGSFLQGEYLYTGDPVKDWPYGEKSRPRKDIHRTKDGTIKPGFEYECLSGADCMSGACSWEDYVRYACVSYTEIDGKQVSIAIDCDCEMNDAGETVCGLDPVKTGRTTDTYYWEYFDDVGGNEVTMYKLESGQPMKSRSFIAKNIAEGTSVPVFVVYGVDVEFAKDPYDINYEIDPSTVRFDDQDLSGESSGVSIELVGAHRRPYTMDFQIYLDSNNFGTKYGSENQYNEIANFVQHMYPPGDVATLGDGWPEGCDDEVMEWPQAIGLQLVENFACGHGWDDEEWDENDVSRIISFPMFLWTTKDFTGMNTVSGFGRLGIKTDYVNKIDCDGEPAWKSWDKYYAGALEDDLFFDEFKFDISIKNDEGECKEKEEALYLQNLGMPSFFYQFRAGAHATFNGVVVNAEYVNNVDYFFDMTKPTFDVSKSINGPHNYLYWMGCGDPDEISQNITIHTCPYPFIEGYPRMKSISNEWVAFQAAADAGAWCQNNFNDPEYFCVEHNDDLSCKAYSPWATVAVPTTDSFVTELNKYKIGDCYMNLFTGLELHRFGWCESCSFVNLAREEVKPSSPNLFNCPTDEFGHYPLMVIPGMDEEFIPVCRVPKLDDPTEYRSWIGLTSWSMGVPDSLYLRDKIKEYLQRGVLPVVDISANEFYEDFSTSRDEHAPYCKDFCDISCDIFCEDNPLSSPTECLKECLQGCRGLENYNDFPEWAKEELGGSYVPEKPFESIVRRIKNQGPIVYIVAYFDSNNVMDADLKQRVIDASSKIRRLCPKCLVGVQIYTVSLDGQVDLTPSERYAKSIIRDVSILFENTEEKPCSVPDSMCNTELIEAVDFIEVAACPDHFYYGGLPEEFYKAHLGVGRELLRLFGKPNILLLEGASPDPGGEYAQYLSENTQNLVRSGNFGFVYEQWETEFDSSLVKRDIGDGPFNVYKLDDGPFDDVYAASRLFVGYKYRTFTQKVGIAEKCPCIPCTVFDDSGLCNGQFNGVGPFCEGYKKGSNVKWPDNCLTEDTCTLDSVELKCSITYEDGTIEQVNVEIDQDNMDLYADYVGSIEGKYETIPCSLKNYSFKTLPSDFYAPEAIIFPKDGSDLADCGTVDLDPEICGFEIPITKRTISCKCLNCPKAPVTCAAGEVSVMCKGKKMCVIPCTGEYSWDEDVCGCVGGEHRCKEGYIWSSDKTECVDVYGCSMHRPPKYSFFDIYAGSCKLFDCDSIQVCTTRIICEKDGSYSDIYIYSPEDCESISNYHRFDSVDGKCLMFCPEGFEPKRAGFWYYYKCEVESVCPQGQELDPVTGECIPSTEECGEGEEFNPDTGECESICELGEEWDSETQTCAPFEEAICEHGAYWDADLEECICDFGEYKEEEYACILDNGCKVGEVKVGDECVASGTACSSNEGWVEETQECVNVLTYCGEGNYWYEDFQECLVPSDECPGISLWSEKCGRCIYTEPVHVQP